MQYFKKQSKRLLVYIGTLLQWTVVAAVTGAVGGLVGFASSLVGGRILSAVQSHGNRIFGVTVYGQQVLLGLSCLLTAAALVYTGRVVEKQKAVKR